MGQATPFNLADQRTDYRIPYRAVDLLTPLRRAEVV